MKMQKLTTAMLQIGAVSTLTLTGASQAYDTNGLDLLGTGQHETHTILWKSPKNGEKGCPNTNPAATAASFCVSQGGAELESSTVFVVENQWFADGNRTSSPPIQSGGPTPVPQSECYTAAATASGFASSATDGYYNDPALNDQLFVYPTVSTANASGTQGAMRLLFAFSHRPQTLGTSPVFGSYSTSIIDGPGDYQVCTNVEGKITSGGAVAYTSVPDPTTGATINVAAYYSFTQRAVLLGLGCTGTPTVSDMESTMTAFENGSHAIGDPFPATGSVPGGCLSAGWSTMTYLTCDNDGLGCGNLVSKAVPVPAFAAAALGLGLFGITMLTSRRRTIK